MRRIITKSWLTIFTAILILGAAGYLLFRLERKGEEQFVSIKVDLNKQTLRMYWKDEQGSMFRSIATLKAWLERKGERLVFAMNGGMYRKDNAPQGLFIEEQVTLMPVDTLSASGNFYLKPNGIFYIKENQGYICSTGSFVADKNIRYATQSGPMLLIQGQVHPAFQKGSVNRQIRNGVGILPDHRILFAMSKKEINFYDFAMFFKEAGCRNALYLDGFVSRTYLPGKNWIQTDGNFGVIIGVTDQRSKSE